MSRFFAFAISVALIATLGCLRRAEVKVAPEDKTEPAVVAKDPAEPLIDKVAPMPRELPWRPEPVKVEVAPFPHEPADAAPGLVAP